MNFEIKNRFSGAVMFTCELTAEIAEKSYSLQLGFAVKAALKAHAYLAGADFTDANFTGAYLAGADFTGADFTGANLADANFTGAYLADANFTGAYLAGADFTGADFTGANFTGANLAGAKNVPETNGSEVADPAARAARLRERALRYREEHPEVPVVESLDAKILAALTSGGTLDMSTWHHCETTHCRAGWAITLAGEAGTKLEDKHGPEQAGAMIYRASTGYVPYFFGSTDDAMEDIRKCAEQHVAMGAGV